MSVWGKFLPSITVPTGGWMFAWDDAIEPGNHEVTIPAGTYDSILELCDALADLIAAVNATGAITVSSTGYVTIHIEGTAGEDWASTADDLEACLGFAGTEDFASDEMTGTVAHRYGWYPGIITFGTTQGAGLSADDGWNPEDTDESAMTGSGQACIIQPDRDIHTRRLTFDIVKRDEREDPYKGVAMMQRYARTKAIRWYPDRADGTVAAPGTQGDPEDDPRDSSCDYWLVTLNERPNVQRGQGHPDHFVVSLNMNGEPD